ncbi:amidase family protein [Streptomyces sp. NBC_01410]|uniref:amidase n=1 Tax=Streptomyces sp. NBC_01410 TaxID=2903856 RepID=UPI00324C7870
MSAAGISRTRQMLQQGETSVAEHVQSVLSDIRDRDGDVGAFIAVAGDEALVAAEQADARIRELGPAAWQQTPLLGVTVSVKDLIQTEGLPTTRGSLLDNPRPDIDAPAVARLRAAGAIVVGKTTTSEYGWSASTVCRVAPATRNPWNLARTAGGSSGGAAAALAAGLCSASLGTDGAGSIRIPAAFCGVVGYKPSFGRVPYVPSGAERLAHLGPLAKNVPDVMELAAVLAGPDRSDPDSGLGSLDAPREARRLRVGWIEYAGTSEEVRRVSERAWSVLVEQGHRLERIEVRCRDIYPALVDIVAATEAATTAPEDEERIDFGRLAVVRHGRTVSGATVMRAEEVRHSLRTTLRSVMDRFDLLAMATVPVEPFDAEAIGPTWAADPGDLLWLAWAPASYPFNMTGQPALSMPAGLTRSGLPVGLQLVGPVGADDLVLSTALRIEAELGELAPAPVRVTERML